MKKKIKYKYKLTSLAILGLTLLWVNYYHISYSTQKYIFNNPDELTEFDYALFLGTPKKLASGDVNNYYKNRISAAVELYESGKTNTFIISADSLNKYQENEVELIKTDLILSEINPSSIILDNDGNRTYKSITNIDINTVHKYIIISQKFHLERALYIAKNKGHYAIGFTAKGGMSNQLWLREILARVKMQMDLLMDN